ncbi:putative transporter [Spathaspora sp. JA1]|nr:putative transporter [Spathaspora sp. JA1]
MVLFPTINRIANPNTGLNLPGGRRRRLFIPPSTQYPLFLYGEGEDQRSFLSLIEAGSESYISDDISDAASVSSTRSLPSSLSTVDDQESFHSWLVEEHRRISFSNDEEEGEDQDLEEQLEQHNKRRRRGSRRRSSASSSIKDFIHLRTTYSLEIFTLSRHAFPLIITFILEHFFSIVCLIVVGKLGTRELAAVSLATMTSTITFAIFEGSATALDTLCPQAYGAGNPELMLIFVQRSILFSWTLFIPCAIFWWYSAHLFQYIIDDEVVVDLTSKFLRILIVGGPGYIFFENSKRFLQAQGIFEAGTGILFVAAPLNILLSWFLVWNETYGLGYIGAPIATAFNFWFMSFLMIMYVRFIDGYKCWFGISSFRELISNWSQLYRLAIPGIVMIESEYIAYEIMTLFASYFGTKQLAAQSAVSSIASLAYMIPFAVSIAASTRIANFIGGQNKPGAIISTRIAQLASIMVASFNCIVLYSFRKQIAQIFTRDPEVIKLIDDLFNPLVAVIQLFDGVACINSGILRAQGRQKIGGFINFIAYYALGLPLALTLSKIIGLELFGLWIGIGVGMAMIGITETVIILWSDWEEILIRAGLLIECEEDEDIDEGSGFFT